MLTQILSVEHLQWLARAQECLRAGELVAFPTDTVYGLGADLHNPEAIQKLYSAKGRDASKAIAVLIGDSSALNSVAGEMPDEISNRVKKLVNRFWPGPLTLVVPRHQGIPHILSPLPTIGVRMPDLEITLQLLRASGPLAVTSANLSGGASPSTAAEVMAQLGGRIAMIVDGGQTPGKLPSTVVDCTHQPPVILRQGPISQDEIDHCIHFL